MSSELAWLCLTAFTTGMLHTAVGPDHYVPFVAMSRVGRWPLPKTLLITLLCGIGHVGSSVLLGAAGVAFGAWIFQPGSVESQLTGIESDRGNLAGWLLVGFGLMYLVWGVMQAVRNRPHTHPHVHADGTLHVHEHVHQAEHLHVHAAVPAGASVETARGTLTPWVLFTIFLFGPCEPLIPLMMAPMIQGNSWGVAMVTLMFSLATIGTMLGIVALMWLGVGLFQRAGAKLERFGHALAGAAVLACGLAIKLGM